MSVPSVFALGEDFPTLRCTSCAASLRRTVKGKPNTNTLCTHCKVYSTPEYQRKRYAKKNNGPIGPGAELAAKSMVEARSLYGHDIKHMDNDSEPDTWVGECNDCLHLLVVDLEEKDRYGNPSPVYGLAYGLICPRQLAIRPAERRNPMMEDAVNQATQLSTGEENLGSWDHNWNDAEANAAFGQKKGPGA